MGIDVGPLADRSSKYGMGTYTHELLSTLEVEARGADVQIDRINAFRANLSDYDIVHFTKFRPFFLFLPF